MFYQCSSGKHGECSKVLNGRYSCVCDCPCHGGRKLPANPCKRCSGTGRHGPWSVESGICFRCEGSGEEPSKQKQALRNFADRLIENLGSDGAL